MKTSELIGAALDWAVAEAEGKTWAVWRFKEQNDEGDLQYGSDWSLAGPIIEREGIALEHMPFAKEWEARLYPTDGTPWVLTGPTPLIAAMRCFVASRLGNEVNIPEGVKP